MTVPIVEMGLSPEITPGGGRIMQLIKRDLDINSPTYGQDQMVVDIFGPNKKDQGVCLLSNFSGLYHAPRSPVRVSWAFQEGSTPSPFPRVDERILDIRLGCQGNTQLELEQIEQQLWSILTFEQDAILRVYSQLSAPRELQVRLDRKPKDTWQYDSSATNLLIWEITLVACNPWWYDTTLTSTWTNTGGTGSGFLTLTNPANVECWVQYASAQFDVDTTQTWTLPDGIAIWPPGSLNSLDVSIAGDPVTVSLPTLAAGQEFLVDTYPLGRTLMVRDGSQAWARLNGVAFQNSVPPFTPPTQVPISVVGGDTNSSVTAYMTLRHDRPWGD